MKRNTIVFATLAFLTIAVVVSAQGVFSTEVGPLTYDQPTKVGKIIDDLSQQFGFGVRVEGVPPVDRTYTGTIPKMSLAKAIDILMETVNSTASMSNNLLVIYAPGLKPPVEELAQQPARSAITADSDDARVEEIKRRYSQTAGQDLPVDLQNQMSTELYRAEQARLQTAVAVTPQQARVGQDLPVDVQNVLGRAYYTGMSGGFYDPYGYYFLAFDRCVANPRHRDCRMGKLKLNGEGAHFLSEFLRVSFGGDGLLSKVDIYVQPIFPDGTEGPVDNLGPASKRNNIFNKALRLPVGRYRVRFVLVERNLLLYDDTTQVWSEWDTKGEPTILQVDSNHFKNAPFLVAVERDLQSKKAAKVLR
ncbi:MAG: hypothetical protein HY336_01555 [Candidatus Doudnabacteria bacterium]|nr:hypothetical protein [Candidatus Doudnabacteria bacterium]